MTCTDNNVRDEIRLSVVYDDYWLHRWILLVQRLEAVDHRGRYRTDDAANGAAMLIDSEDNDVECLDSKWTSKRLRTNHLDSRLPYDLFNAGYIRYLTSWPGHNRTFERMVDAACDALSRVCDELLIDAGILNMLQSAYVHDFDEMRTDISRMYVMRIRLDANGMPELVMSDHVDNPLNRLSINSQHQHQAMSDIKITPLEGVDGCEMVTSDSISQLANFVSVVNRYDDVMSKTWLNLTNGLEMAELLDSCHIDYGLCRIRSTDFEQKRWDRALTLMPDEMLIGLMQGVRQIVVDFGANKQCSRAMRQGMPIMARIVARALDMKVDEKMSIFSRDGSCQHVSLDFTREAMRLSDSAKTKLSYCLKFKRPDVKAVRLSLLSMPTTHDNDYALHSRQLTESIDRHYAHALTC